MSSTAAFGLASRQRFRASTSCAWLGAVTTAQSRFSAQTASSRTANSHGNQRRLPPEREPPPLERDPPDEGPLGLDGPDALDGPEEPLALLPEPLLVPLPADFDEAAPVLLSPDALPEPPDLLVTALPPPVQL